MNERPAERGGKTRAEDNYIYINYIPSPYQSLDNNGKVHTVNDEWLAELGYDRKEVIGQPFGDFLTDESAGKFDSHFSKLKDSGVATNVDLEMIHANGHSILVSFDGQIQYDEDGHVLRTHHQFSNITGERDKIETVQKRSRYQQVLSEVNEILVRTDDTEQMLKEAIDIIPSLGKFECAILTLVGESNFQCISERKSELSGVDVADFHTERYVKEVMENETIEIDDVTERPFVPHLEDKPSHAGIAVGITHEDQEFGVLTIHLVPGKEPSDKEMVFLENLGDNIGIFLRNQQIDRKRRERQRELERRERMFRELHTTKQEFLSAENESDLFECIVDGIDSVLDFTLFGVMAFDENEGILQTAALSPRLSEVLPESPAVEPGDNPIWQVFRSGETRRFDEINSVTFPGKLDTPVTDLLVVPIGQFGVIHVGVTEEDWFDDVDVEVIELIAANARIIVDRIRSERELDEVSRRLSCKKSQIRELEELMGSIESIQQRFVDSETRDALEIVVCEELAATERVDFVWIGRPQSSDTELSPTAWAGSGHGYLNAVDTENDDVLLPSQSAARRRERIRISSISERVLEEGWATDAVSREFSSVLSLPLVYDDVLYGILTAYSSEESAFDELFETLFADVASLLVTYFRILNIRYADSNSGFVEVEFEIGDLNYPLYSLAVETESTIRFDTVAETTDRAVNIFVTVVKGDSERVLDQATNITKIRDADWFGNPENRQLKLKILRPFLASKVTKHGGYLVNSLADGDTASVVIKLPSSVSVRPLFEWLTSKYADIDLVARRETRSADPHEIARPEEFLTDRQFEILKAAYSGGYYEVPREVTGEDLADSFGISNPAVYKHLQTAHRTLLEKIFDSNADNERLND